MSLDFLSFSRVDVSLHNKETDAWIICYNSVFNITPFMNGHPGGADILKENLGTDITRLFFNKDVHSHSDSALSILLTFKVGNLAATDVKGEIPSLEKFCNKNYKKSIVNSCGVDFSKPIISQIWKMDLETYVKFIHTPIHINGSARLFDNFFLEFCSRTSPYMIPLIWLPFISLVFYWSIFIRHESLGLIASIPVALGGILFWTLFEYMLHRYVLHVDDKLPDIPLFIMTHFFLHGIHHLMPMDPLRLVFPPAVAVILQVPVVMFMWTVFGPLSTPALYVGFMVGYVYYDLCHFFLHHSNPTNYFFKSMKTQHMEHHYKDFNKGFGVSSKLWDFIFEDVLSSAKEFKSELILRSDKTLKFE